MLRQLLTCARIKRPFYVERMHGKRTRPAFQIALIHRYQYPYGATIEMRKYRDLNTATLRRMHAAHAATLPLGNFLHRLAQGSLAKRRVERTEDRKRELAKTQSGIAEIASVGGRNARCRSLA